MLPIRTFYKDFDKPRVGFSARRLKVTQGYNVAAFPRTKDGKRVFCVVWSAGFFDLRHAIPV